MKIDIDCSYSYDCAKQFIENEDAMQMFRWMLNIQLLGKFYKDKQSYDLACEIAESVGFNKFLKRKHTYEELQEYYNDNCCEDSDSLVDIPDVEEEEENCDNSFAVGTTKLSCSSRSNEVAAAATEITEETVKPFAVRHIEFDDDITEDVDQKTAAIKEGLSKREILKNRKLNLK